LRLNGKSATLSYDAKLRWNATTFAGGDQTTRQLLSWDPVAKLESNQASLDQLTRKLEYDDAGRIRSQFTAPIPIEFGNFFGYDGLGRLKADTFAVVESDQCTFNNDDGYVCPDPVADSVHTNWYDAVGNRDSTRSTASGLVTGSYDTGNRIRQWAGCSYEPDADGNVIKRTCGSEVTNFWWSAEGRLDSLEVGSTKVRHYYDASGRLVKRDAAGTVRYFLWHGAQLLAELDAGGNRLVEYSYYPGLDRLHAVGVKDTVFFGHADGMGNVIGLVSEGRAIAGNSSYDRRTLVRAGRCGRTCPWDQQVSLAE
jgi:hypothetical protein